MTDDQDAEVESKRVKKLSNAFMESISSYEDDISERTMAAALGIVVGCCTKASHKPEKFAERLLHFANGITSGELLDESTDTEKEPKDE